MLIINIRNSEARDYYLLRPSYPGCSMYKLLHDRSIRYASKYCMNKTLNFFYIAQIDWIICLRLKFLTRFPTHNFMYDTLFQFKLLISQVCNIYAITHDIRLNAKMGLWNLLGKSKTRNTCCIWIICPIYNQVFK